MDDRRNGYTFKVGISVKICLPSEKSVYSKRKEFAPKGRKCFASRIHH